jgi:hypothetical protein
VSGTASPLAVSCCVLPQQRAEDEDAGEEEASPPRPPPPVLALSFAISEDALADNGEPADTLVLRWGAAERPSAPLLASLASVSDEDDEDDGGRNGDNHNHNGDAPPPPPPPLHSPRAFSCPLDPSVHSWAAGGGASETTFGATFPPPCNVGTESGKTQRGGGGPPLGVPAANNGGRMHALLLRFPLSRAEGNAALCKGGLAFVLKTATRVWLSYDGLDASAGVRGGHFFVPTGAFAQLAGMEAWGMEEQQAVAAEDDDEVEPEAEMAATEEEEEQQQQPEAAAPLDPAEAAARAARAAAAASPSPDPADAVAAAAAAAIAAFVSASSSGSSHSSSSEEEEQAGAVVSAAATTTTPTAVAPTAAAAGRTARVLAALAARPPDPPLVASLVRGSAPPSRLATGGGTGAPAPTSSSPEAAPVPACGWAVARIAAEEPGAERSLMHRFRAAERLLADAERERGSDAPRALLAAAAWLRFSAARHLVWVRKRNGRLPPPSPVRQAPRRRARCPLSP